MQAGFGACRVEWPPVKNLQEKTAADVRISHLFLTLFRGHYGTHEIADSSETWASVSDVTKAFRFSIKRHENQSMCVCMTAQRTSTRPKNENETPGRRRSTPPHE
ncbi:hypothetical protein MTP99_006076 [Tenebrio molitor]|nr:hypothetical protein MTP99_006076 [Tenebrio molitor]